MPVGVGGWLAGSPASIPPVSVTAPGAVTLLFTEDSTYSDTSQSERYGRPVRGTSAATPIVAGGVAILRHAYPLHAALGAGYLRALMLAMAASGGERETYGVGRLMLRDLSDLNSPAGWYSPAAFHMDQYDEIDFPFPGTASGSGAQQFKLAVYIDEPDRNKVPWVLVNVVDTCNSNQMVASDVSFSLEKQLDVTIGDYGLLPTACLEVQLYGYSVAEGGVTVYITGYFHNGIH